DPGVAGRAVTATEAVGSTSGADLYQRTTGRSPGAAQVLSLAAGAAQRDADKRVFDAEPGALGQALARAGRRPAVIASAAAGASESTDLPALHREAALAMMDREGRIDGGGVDRSLTVADPSAPGGIRMDEAAVLRAFDRAWADDDAVLVELSDLERA